MKMKKKYNENENEDGGLFVWQIPTTWSVVHVFEWNMGWSLLLFRFHLPQEISFSQLCGPA